MYSENVSIREVFWFLQLKPNKGLRGFYGNLYPRRSRRAGTECEGLGRILLWYILTTRGRQAIVQSISEYFHYRDSTVGRAIADIYSEHSLTASSILLRRLPDRDNSWISSAPPILTRPMKILGTVRRPVNDIKTSAIALPREANLSKWTTLTPR